MEENRLLILKSLFLNSFLFTMCAMLQFHQRSVKYQCGPFIIHLLYLSLFTKFIKVYLIIKSLHGFKKSLGTKINVNLSFNLIMS